MIKGPVKPLNFLVSGYSFLKSSITGKAVAYGMPLAIGAELTNHCNLRCPECITGSGQMKRERGFMDLTLFRRVIGELQPYLFNVNLYFQGEPLMHPGFQSFIRACGKTRSVIATNGHFLSAENCEKIAGSGLGKLIISLDGIDDETYSAYRVNGSIIAVRDGLKNITDAVRKQGSSLETEIQVLVNRLNEKQIPLIKELAHSMNCSIKLKSMQIGSKENAGHWMPANGRFRRYEIKNDEFRIKSKLKGICARLWFNPVITWDGKVVPCCFDKNGEHVMGDLNQETFREIWNGSKYRLFRRRLLAERDTIEICRNCTSGLKGVIV